jgi:hypothetical protein
VGPGGSLLRQPRTEARPFGRERRQRDAPRLDPLVRGDHVAVVRTVVGINVRLGGPVVRLRRHEDPQSKRGHDTEQHDREA